MTKSDKLKKTLVYIFLAIGAFFMIFPFIWMIITSFKTGFEANRVPPTFLPENPTFNNYLTALKVAPFGRYFLNSVIVTICCVALTMFNSILAAFSFSKLKFPGRDILFALLISMMMISE